jgi:hypothetical protein
MLLLTLVDVHFATVAFRIQKSTYLYSYLKSENF